MLTEIGAPSLLSMSVKTKGVAFLKRSKLYQGEGKKSEELRNRGKRVKLPRILQETRKPLSSLLRRLRMHVPLAQAGH